MDIDENHTKSIKYDESLQRARSQPGIEQRFLVGQQLSPSKVQAYKHEKVESPISKAAIACAKRSTILSSEHRGLAAEAVACKSNNK